MHPADTRQVLRTPKYEFSREAGGPTWARRSPGFRCLPLTALGSPLRSHAVGAFGEGEFDGAEAVVAHELDFDRVARFVAEEHFRERVGLGEGITVDADDHVIDLNAGFFRRAARRDFLDVDAGDG